MDHQRRANHANHQPQTWPRRGLAERRRNTARGVVATCVALVALTIPALSMSPVWAQDAASPTLEYPEWFHPTLYDLGADLDDAVAEGKRGLALFFSAEQCLHCIAMARSTFRDPEVIERFGGHYAVIALDVFSDVELIDPDGQITTPRDFAIAERAQFTPTLLFIGPDGDRLARRVGFLDSEQILALLDRIEDRATANAITSDDRDRRIPSGTGAADGAPPAGFATAPIDLARAASQHHGTLVFFEAHGHPETALYRELLEHEEIQLALSDWQRLAVDGQDSGRMIVTPDGTRTTAARWVETLDLGQLPALVWLLPDGREALRIDSGWLIDFDGQYRDTITPANVDSFLSRLEYVESGAFETHPQYQRWRAERLRATQGL